MMLTDRYRIEIANRQKLLSPDRKLLRRAVRSVLQGEGVPSAEISLTITSDQEIAVLNQTYLHHEGPTDVITFPLSRQDELTLEGEIVASAETALREAERRKLDPMQELCLYVIHGALHLCGHDDLAPSARRRMRSRERHYLGQLFGSGPKPVQ